MEGDRDKSGYRLMANVLLKRHMLETLTKIAEERSQEARALRKADAEKLTEKLKHDIRTLKENPPLRWTSSLIGSICAICQEEFEVSV